MPLQQLSVRPNRCCFVGHRIKVWSTQIYSQQLLETRKADKQPRQGKQVYGMATKWPTATIFFSTCHAAASHSQRHSYTHTLLFLFCCLAQPVTRLALGLHGGHESVTIALWPSAQTADGHGEGLRELAIALQILKPLTGGKWRKGPFPFLDSI